MRGLTLNQKEQNRLQVLNRLLEGVLDVGEASELLGVSQRQVRRLRAAYREEGASALAHGNRGRSPNHKVSEEMRSRVVELGSDRYAGFNHTHLTEELGRHEGIALSRSTVRRILSSAGIRSPRKRRSPKHRVRRERYGQEGMLLQVDGSRHDWLEGRGPYLTLIGAVDDATGTIPHALSRKMRMATSCCWRGSSETRAPLWRCTVTVMGYFRGPLRTLRVWRSSWRVSAAPPSSAGR